jgi:hypothetical protein
MNTLYAWTAAGALVYRAGLSDAGESLSEFVGQAARQIAGCRASDARRVTVCFLSFLIGTRFAAEPLRDAYAAAAEDALGRFGDDCALGVRALPAMGGAGLALLRRAVVGDFSERSTLSAVCEAAAAFARETGAAWLADVLARALRPFRDAMLSVKGVSEADDIARPLVRNFAEWAAAVSAAAPLDLLERVLECTLVYLQQCFRAPAFIAHMLRLFASGARETGRVLSAVRVPVRTRVRRKRWRVGGHRRNRRRVQ